MKIFIRYKNILILFFPVIVLFNSCSVDYGGGKDNLSWVDPSIGGVGLILQPTRPAVQLPNQPVRVYPVRNDCLDGLIRWFPLTIISHRQGEMSGIMPFTGTELKSFPVSSWDKDYETATPYYYSVLLEDFNIVAEFTPGAKSGYFRFGYPEGRDMSLFFANSAPGSWSKTGEISVDGSYSFEGMTTWFHGEFSADFEIREENINGKRSQFAVFSPADGRTVGLKYALSFISPEQAAMNFENEIAGRTFEEVRDHAREQWEKVLGRIKVEGGTESQKRTFYTALYRCYERMVNISEDGRYYSNYDSLVHESERDFYVDDWIWDTYLALHPLRSILDPALEADMIQSYVEMYGQSGWMPTFPVLFGDTPCMNGFHSTIMILDGYRKGIRNFDTEKAYEGMKKNAMEATMLPWRNGPSCELDTFYFKEGFYPALWPGEKETVQLVHDFEKRQSVAVTLGHSYDDWALAEFARELGKEEDYRVFKKRSENYRNLWNPEKLFFMPKDKYGKWIDIDPEWDGGMGGRDYYDENNGWTYMWQVQHDLPGLVDLMRGKRSFEIRLDQLFNRNPGRSKYETWSKFPDFTGIVGQFSMGNEPSFHIPYLYNLTGSPWKTQKRIRMLLDTWFPDNIFGIPGDEDGGGMSAFIVFSSMGFYPLTPGIPVYTLGSPVFNKITIELPEGREFIINAKNNSPVNKYIKKAFLNGKPVENLSFTHIELMAGGVLELEMSPFPEVSK
jgi:predicted alpha-1,2-mannosidase